MDNISVLLYVRSSETKVFLLKDLFLYYAVFFQIYPSLLACLLNKSILGTKTQGVGDLVLLLARLEPLQPSLQSVLLRRAIRPLITRCKSNVSEEERVYYQSANGVLFSPILSFPPLCAFPAKIIRHPSFGLTQT